MSDECWFCDSDGFLPIKNDAPLCEGCIKNLGRFSSWLQGDNGYLRDEQDQTVTITLSREDAEQLAHYTDPGSVLMAHGRVQKACREALGESE